MTLTGRISWSSLGGGRVTAKGGWFMYQAISCVFVSRTKLARACLSVTSLLVQVVGVPRSLFFWCPECCAQFRSLVDLRNPGVRLRHR